MKKNLKGGEDKPQVDKKSRWINNDKPFSYSMEKVQRWSSSVVWISQIKMISPFTPIWSPEVQTGNPVWWAPHVPFHKRAKIISSWSPKGSTLRCVGLIFDQVGHGAP